MGLGSAQLSLTLATIGGGLEFLDTFIVPGLRTLEVPERSLGSNPIDYLTSFIPKSRCKLHKLHITNNRTSEDSYHLAFASGIPELSLEGSILDPISDEEYSEDEDAESGSSDGQGNPTLVQINCVCVVYVLLQVSRSFGAHLLNTEQL
jgi:hypothetical protein